MQSLDKACSSCESLGSWKINTRAPALHGGAPGIFSLGHIHALNLAPLSTYIFKDAGWNLFIEIRYSKDSSESGSGVWNCINIAVGSSFPLMVARAWMPHVLPASSKYTNPPARRKSTRGSCTISRALLTILQSVFSRERGWANAKLRASDGIFPLKRPAPPSVSLTQGDRAIFHSFSVAAHSWTPRNNSRTPTPIRRPSRTSREKPASMGSFRPKSLTAPCSHGTSRSQRFSGSNTRLVVIGARDLGNSDESSSSIISVLMRLQLPVTFIF
mmetsp:Transcript_9130/g.11685  ORF Transcript_9130/g.11685 Transcript_9130/m.11685 type:complete len:272 (-) Transcript_9130:1123-1938(-)